MDRAELNHRAAADGLPPLLAAMWHHARGDWNAAHEIAQGVDSRDGAWVHAFLHRVEGDLRNADYWYRRAGRTRPDLTLNEECEEIVGAL